MTGGREGQLAGEVSAVPCVEEGGVGEGGVEGEEGGGGGGGGGVEGDVH